MAYWFHRNPLKATVPVTFELHGVSTDERTRKIFRELRQARSQLLEQLTDPGHDKTTIEKSSGNYFALLHGLHQAVGNEANKLQNLIEFRWSNTLLGNAAVKQNDAVFEYISMVINVALWYTKHAAKLAAKEEPDMEEAKDVHKCLRTAAGIFTFVKTELIPKLVENTKNAVDTDSRVLEAYIHQSTAEAQEVTTARAIELKHNSSLVAALAYETAQMFKKADDALASLDVTVVGKWRKYCQLKSDFYSAYAFGYHGEVLLAQDKCGEAIKCLEEAEKYYSRSSSVCKEYASTKGAGTTARPQDHLFFRQLAPVIRRTLDKCHRENGLIYHQKVPYDSPAIELKPTYGLVSPEEYQPPALNPQWTIDVYNKFDESKASKQSESVQEKKPGKQEEIPAAKEKEYPMSDKDPENSSGCVVS